MATLSAPTQDLARIHELVSDLFRYPQTPDEWEPYRLSEEQVAFYHENGYLAGVKLLDERQIEALRSELAQLIQPEHPGSEYWYEYHSNESSNPDSVLFHALGAWRITPGFHDVLWNPAFVMAASQLLGDAPVRSWHQDYSYWTRTRPMAHLTCWTGLDDADTQNGCLYYVPGSHRWGLLDKPELAGDMNGIMNFLSEEQKRQFQPIPIELKRGHAAFHHPLMVHGSYENRSDRPRRAFVLNVFRDGTLSDSHDVLLSGVPPIPKGDVMQGDFFPLLYEGQ
jgi:hypothetical protein